MSAATGSEDVDLTNLNWVPGAPAPLPASFSVSPPDQKSPSNRNRGSPFSPFPGCTILSNTSSPASQSRPVEIVVTNSWRNENVFTPQSPPVLHNCSSHPSTPQRRRNTSLCNNNSEYPKPNCSYTCLIGMALKASPGTDGCLPVNEIYKYIEKEFPYFKTAPDGWKNSVRHNLSLNPSFRKVTRTDGWQGKKGFFWEIAPEKKEAVDSEVDAFLKCLGKELQPHSTLLTSPIQPTARQDRFPRQSTPCKPTTPRQQSTPCKVTVPRQSTPSCRVTASKVTTPSKQKMKPPPEVAQYSPQIQEQIMASQIQVRSEPSPTQREFDMDNTPSEYIGIEAPSGDPNESARELFGLDTTPVSKNYQFQQQSNGANGSDGPLVPLYTPVTPFYGTIYGYPYPVANSSPSPLIAVPPPSHFMPPYLPSQYVHYLPNNQTGIVYGPTVGNQIGNQMMFNMGYNAPNENNLEMETANDSEDSRSIDMNEDDEVLRHKQAPSTPTSHFAQGNGYAQKRLRLNDDAAVSPAHLADTEGQNVSVDAIVAQLLGQSNGSIDGIGLHGLSDHEKEHYLQQFVGLVDLDNLFRSNQNSFTSSSCTPSENTASSFEESGSICDNSVRSSTVPRFESLLDINDQNIKCMQDGLIGNQGAQLDNSDIIYPQSPLCTEEVIVETYQG